MARIRCSRSAAIVLIVALAFVSGACSSHGSGSSSSDGSPQAPSGPAPTGTVPGAGDLKTFDTASSASAPFKAQSLDRRREMARQICDAITEKTGGNALEWIQRANTEPSIIPFDSPDYPDLLLFTSAALRYQCPGYLEQVQHSGGSLPMPAK